MKKSILLLFSSINILLITAPLCAMENNSLKNIDSNLAALGLADPFEHESSSTDNQALHNAIMAGDFNAVHTLLNNSNINLEAVCSFDNLTPLQCAVAMMSCPRADTEEIFRIVQLLIDKEANVHNPGYIYRTPFELAKKVDNNAQLLDLFKAAEARA